jgi:hypothetical protein
MGFACRAATRRRRAATTAPRARRAGGDARIELMMKPSPWSFQRMYSCGGGRGRGAVVRGARGGPGGEVCEQGAVNADSRGRTRTSAARPSAAHAPCRRHPAGCSRVSRATRSFSQTWRRGCRRRRRRRSTKGRARRPQTKGRPSACPVRERGRLCRRGRGRGRRGRDAQGLAAAGRGSGEEEGDHTPPHTKLRVGVGTR